MSYELNASVLVARSPIYGVIRAAAVGGVLGSLARPPLRRGSNGYESLMHQYQRKTRS